MPSPFPGMDPYIEMFEWEDFHTRSLTIACELLAKQMPKGYVARVERRSYLEMEWDWDVQSQQSLQKIVVPDLTVSQTRQMTERISSASLVPEPLHQRFPKLLEHREAYVEIREAKSRVVITALELLSPTNKRAGSVGGQLYSEKRRAVLESQTHFVEIDLLRGGQRILFSEPGLPVESDYYAYISRVEQRPDVALYAWSLRDRLPVIPIPLKAGDGHLSLDLQEMLNLTYERADYSATLDYYQPLRPGLRAADISWVSTVVGSAADE